MQRHAWTSPATRCGPKPRGTITYLQYSAVLFTVQYTHQTRVPDSEDALAKDWKGCTGSSQPFPAISCWLTALTLKARLLLALACPVDGPVKVL